MQTNSRRRALAVLGLGFGIAVIPTPTSAATPAVHPDSLISKHPDFDPDALHLSTTTDTLPDDEAAGYETIAGDPVHRVYYLHNNGLLPLENVTVSDPETDGATIQCGPEGTPTIATLLPLTGTSCSATFTATQGEHQTTITASGTVFLLGATVGDQTAAGYTAVTLPSLGASLSLDGKQQSVNLPVGSPVSAVVTVVNTGSVTLTQVAPQPPQPPLSILGCGTSSLIISTLAAGASAFCTGALIPAPGTHVSSVTITGNWLWDRPLTAQGPQQAQVLKVQTVADSAYTGIPITGPTPPPPPPTPSAPASNPAPPPPTPAPATSSAAVVPPQSPPTTPSPTPSPHVSAPALAGAEVQAVPPFKASRGLSLPLKVLVIIIVPVVAAAAGARRMASRR